MLNTIKRSLAANFGEKGCLEYKIIYKGHNRVYLYVMVTLPNKRDRHVYESCRAAKALFVFNTFDNLLRPRRSRKTVSDNGGGGPHKF